MNDADAIDRFEELEAGRVLGDLTAEEWEEWRQLSSSIPEGHDRSLELVAAAIEADIASGVEEPMPEGLADLVLKDAAGFVTSPAPGTVVAGKFPGKSAAHAVIAWSIAAVFAFLLVAENLVKTRTQEGPTSVQALDDLKKSADDLIKKAFSGLGDYEPMTGEVVWSDREQEGYMILSNLPANDPASNQYQLWIVDPSRDEAPVDGGVFDIPAGASTAIIPIDAKLAVQKPQSFVITLEQPGGVVKSKLQTVVAAAKVS